MHLTNCHRQAFSDAVDAFEQWDDGEPEPTINFRGDSITISRACGLVWRCTDILPLALSDQVRDHERPFEASTTRRNTYAAAARLIKDRIRVN